jgi:hypothetical protein
MSINYTAVLSQIKVWSRVLKKLIIIQLMKFLSKYIIKGSGVMSYGISDFDFEW